MTYSWIATGGNLTSTILLKVLLQLEVMGKPCPHTILLQVDGASDNWTHTNFCFFSWLLLQVTTGDGVARDVLDWMF